jgi:hypothetical protein
MPSAANPDDQQVPALECAVPSVDKNIAGMYVTRHSISRISSKQLAHRVAHELRRVKVCVLRHGWEWRVLQPREAAHVHVDKLDAR